VVKSVGSVILFFFPLVDFRDRFGTRVVPRIADDLIMVGPVWGGPIVGFFVFFVVLSPSCPCCL